MLGNKKVICVIPARLGSKRFPRKVLAPLRGKPLLQWAYEGAKNVSFFDEVVVAVDSEELKGAVEGFGGRALLTSPLCKSGTDRLVELQKNGGLQGDIWVNWQGDEPFITEEAIKSLLQSAHDTEGEVWTLKKKISQQALIASSNIVKVVCDSQGLALYFSRSVIPYEGLEVFKHVGLYAFSSEALKKIGTLEPCPLEIQENLEQLRFLFHGMKIQVHETSEDIFGIDTKQQLEEAEHLSFS